MRNNNYPNHHEIKTIVFDFDGVFTDNKVYLNEEGIESVRCDRSDGLAFNILKKFIEKNKLDLNLIVLTKEKNKVVQKRCNKLGIKCKSGIDNKKNFLLDKLSNSYDKERNLISGLVYLGNDLNDLGAIMISEFSFSPIDAHEIIKASVDFVLPNKGGEGFIRNFVEKILRFDNMNKQELLDLL